MPHSSSQLQCHPGKESYKWERAGLLPIHKYLAGQLENVAEEDNYSLMLERKSLRWRSGRIPTESACAMMAGLRMVILIDSIAVKVVKSAVSTNFAACSINSG